MISESFRSFFYSVRLRAFLCALLFLSAAGRTLVGGVEKELHGIVIVVYDGDTVKVRLTDGTDEKVRLLGIDSPEMDDTRDAVRFMAITAKRFAFWKLFRTRVTLVSDHFTRDKYGRLLASCLMSDGSSFNEIILRAGFALRLRRFPLNPDLERKLDAAEASARKEGRGLWRKDPPPRVTEKDIPRFVGEIVSAEMKCVGMSKRKKFDVLQTESDSFDVLVPERDRASFPGLEEIVGREIVVTGFVETFRGRPQIILSLPGQLARKGGGGSDTNRFLNSPAAGIIKFIGRPAWREKREGGTHASSSGC